MVVETIVEDVLEFGTILKVPVIVSSGSSPVHSGGGNIPAPVRDERASRPTA